METVANVCDLCQGRRFVDYVLEYKLRGKNIAEALDMPIEEANEFFDAEKAARVVLQRLVDVGLGYIQLGQTLNTLSGGERQRLKLAIEMGTDTDVCVLDEPTTGLHLQDVDQLLGLLDRLVDDGRTVIVIEHNLDVVAHADWVIDMGPGAGHDGGRVVFEGTPADLLDAGTLTGRHLGRRLGG
jgi:excinuclease UvrABC ATPase subunit